MSDRVAVFNNGVVEQVGTPEEIYNQSKTEFVCNFIGDANELSPKIMEEIAMKTDMKIDPTKNLIFEQKRLKRKCLMRIFILFIKSKSDIERILWDIFSI